MANITRKIGIDARIYSTSTGRYVRELINNLQKIDRVNQYYIFLKKKDMNITMPKNFHKVEAEMHWYTTKEQLFFSSIINRHSLDLMHFTFIRPLFYSRPYVITIHDLTLLRFKNAVTNLRKLIYPLKQKTYLSLMASAAKGAIAVIAPTKFVRRDIAKTLKIPSKKILVSYEAAEIKPLRQFESTILQKLKVDGPYLYYVGNAYPHKNLKIVIDALILVNKREKISLIISGAPDMFSKQLQEYVKQKHMARFIKFTGFIPDKDLFYLYKNALSFIFPSLSEGFGIPPLEAMSLGCPVLSSNATCLPEVLDGAALFFDPSSPKDIADKIIQIYSKPSLRKKFIALGHHQSKKYSWDKMAKETHNIYLESIKKSL